MRILFLVHGMGAHGSGWSDVTRAKLNEVTARYSVLDGRPFDQMVTIVPISYDSEFTKHLAAWSGSADGLEKFAKDNAVTLPALFTWLKGASATEKNFFWSHAVDVVLYRFFQLVSVPVRLQVMTQIVNTLRSSMRDGTVVSASVMSHSLGTSVTHDALAYLGTTAFDGSEAFMVGRFQFENIFMVANVGRALETTQLCYDSCVHPQSVKPETACCTRYYNFRHRFDPFPVVRCFKPQGWGEDFITPAEELDHLHEFNVHGFEHYLDHPAVHIPIINGTFGRIVSKEAEAKAIQDYPRVPPGHPCPDKLLGTATRFNQIVDLIHTSDDPIQLVIAGAQFLAAAQEAKNACV